jgi:hypothetical protein
MISAFKGFVFCEGLSSLNRNRLTAAATLLGKRAGTDAKRVQAVPMRGERDGARLQKLKTSGFSRRVRRALNSPAPRSRVGDTK